MHVYVQEALRFKLVAHTCNPSPWETEAESSEVQGQSGLLETFVDRSEEIVQWLRILTTLPDLHLVPI